MNAAWELRNPDTFTRIRALLATLQLRLDLHVREHGCDEEDAAFLEEMYFDIAKVAELVRDRRQGPRDDSVQVPNFLARSS